MIHWCSLAPLDRNDGMHADLQELHIPTLRVLSSHWYCLAKSAKGMAAKEDFPKARLKPRMTDCVSSSSLPCLSIQSYSALQAPLSVSRRDIKLKTTPWFPSLQVMNLRARVTGLVIAQNNWVHCLRDKPQTSIFSCHVYVKLLYIAVMGVSYRTNVHTT